MIIRVSIINSPVSTFVDRDFGHPSIFAAEAIPSLTVQKHTILVSFGYVVNRPGRHLLNIEA